MSEPATELVRAILAADRWFEENCTDCNCDQLGDGERCWFHLSDPERAARRLASVASSFQVEQAIADFRASPRPTESDRRDTERLERALVDARMQWSAAELEVDALRDALEAINGRRLEILANRIDNLCDRWHPSDEQHLRGDAGYLRIIAQPGRPHPTRETRNRPVGSSNATEEGA